MAAALTTFSPFMIYYSAEARGYALMIVLVLGADALPAHGGRARPRRLVGGSTPRARARAVYTHYTSVFALARAACLGPVGASRGRRPRARRHGRRGGRLPALALRAQGRPGLAHDGHPLHPPAVRRRGYVRSSFVHWAIGFPYLTPGTSVGDLPGRRRRSSRSRSRWRSRVAGLLARGAPRTPSAPDRRLVLVIVLAASVPAGEALVSAVGSNLFGTRNLAASWPAFALCLAALLVAAGPRLGIAAAALAIGAFAVGGIKMLDRDFSRAGLRRGGGVHRPHARARATSSWMA